ncbi:RNA-binding protein 39 [Camellia lanceoleosa]|uniref:RNA-binding protein 39 n=1 Tax=Camellia lanceoleosa TaxID=1840588 RepID=A0ACC0H2G8_9ERIC|nr:RNA-binding protein 39 [Camellia lanceoleosa]
MVAAKKVTNQFSIYSLRWKVSIKVDKKQLGKLIVRELLRQRQHRDQKQKKKKKKKNKKKKEKIMKEYYIEFYDAMSMPMAIALSGPLLFGQLVMVKPSEAEKNLVQTNASGGGSVVGSYGAVDRKLYVGNLHFKDTRFQIKQVI